MTDSSEPGSGIQDLTHLLLNELQQAHQCVDAKLSQLIAKYAKISPVCDNNLDFGKDNFKDFKHLSYKMFNNTFDSLTVLIPKAGVVKGAKNILYLLPPVSVAAI